MQNFIIVYIKEFHVYRIVYIRIDDNGIIKVADFGLSEDIYACNYFRQLKGSDNKSASSTVKLPVKWMALESLHDGLFSEKSDVVSIHLPLHSFTCNHYQILNFIVVLWCAVLGSVQPW